MAGLNIMNTTTSADTMTGRIRFGRSVTHRGGPGSVDPARTGLKVWLSAGFCGVLWLAATASAAEPVKAGGDNPAQTPAQAPALAASAEATTRPSTQPSAELIPQKPSGEIKAVAARTLRVALYADEGSKTGGDNVEKCLAFEPSGFSATRVTAEQIRGGVLKDFDVFVAGGGRGSKTAEALQPAGREQVRKFVEGGGGYLGICAGAYLASSDYPWSLNLVNAKVVDKKHWNRDGGPVSLAVTETGKKRLGLTDDELVCNYNQGPLLAPGDHPDLPSYTPLATFGSEIATNGAPSGVMVGTTAIASATVGQGRVIVISPHPEKAMGYNELIRRAVAWVGKADGESPGVGQ